MPFGTDQMVRGTAMVPVRFTSKEGRSATIWYDNCSLGPCRLAHRGTIIAFDQQTDIAKLRKNSITPL